MSRSTLLVVAVFAAAGLVPAAADGRSPLAVTVLQAEPVDERDPEAGAADPEAGGVDPGVVQAQEQQAAPQVSPAEAPASSAAPPPPPAVVAPAPAAASPRVVVPSVRLLRPVRRVDLRRVLTHGLRVAVEHRGAERVWLSLSVTGRFARRLVPGRSSVEIGFVSFTPAGPGRRRAVVRVARRHVAQLRRAETNLPLVLTIGLTPRSI